MKVISQMPQSIAKEAPISNGPSYLTSQSFTILWICRFWVFESSGLQWLSAVSAPALHSVEIGRLWFSNNSRPLQFLALGSAEIRFMAFLSCPCQVFRRFSKKWLPNRFVYFPFSPPTTSKTSLRGPVFRLWCFNQVTRELKKEILGTSSTADRYGFLTILTPACLTSDKLHYWWSFLNRGCLITYHMEAMGTSCKLCSLKFPVNS